MGEGRGRGLVSVPSPFYQDLSPWPHQPLWSHLAEMGGKGGNSQVWTRVLGTHRLPASQEPTQVSSGWWVQSLQAWGAFGANLPRIPLPTPGREEAPTSLFRLLAVPKPDFSLERQSTQFFKSLLPRISPPMAPLFLLLFTLRIRACPWWDFRDHLVDPSTS